MSLIISLLIKIITENIINCKYYDIDEIQTLNKLNNKFTLSLFDINSCSLSKNIEDLKYLLNSTSIYFDTFAISETRIVKGKTPVNSLNLMNYSHELYVFIKLRNWSHHLLRFLILKDLT